MTISFATINTSPATPLRGARELISHLALLMLCCETGGKGALIQGYVAPSLLQHVRTKQLGVHDRVLKGV